MPQAKRRGSSHREHCNQPTAHPADADKPALRRTLDRTEHDESPLLNDKETLHHSANLVKFN
jgi:hypothetical protein